MTFFRQIRIFWWKWLMLRVFARLRVAVGPVEKAPMGLPHMRDPDCPCRGYEPEQYYSIEESRSIRSRSYDCPGDGHYLCQECLYFDQEAYEREHGE